MHISNLIGDLSFADVQVLRVPKSLANQSIMMDLVLESMNAEMRHGDDNMLSTKVNKLSCFSFLPGESHLDTDCAVFNDKALRWVQTHALSCNAID